jgi:hypothetical protein
MANRHGDVNGQSPQTQIPGASQISRSQVIVRYWHKADNPTAPAFVAIGAFSPPIGEGMTTQCRNGRSGDRESPFGSAHFKVRAFDWDPIRAEH